MKQVPQKLVDWARPGKFQEFLWDHQQLAIRPEMRWNMIDSGLQSTMLHVPPIFCIHCHEVYHCSHQYILAYFHPQHLPLLQGTHNSDLLGEDRLGDAFCGTKASAYFMGTTATCHRAYDCPSDSIYKQFLDMAPFIFIIFSWSLFNLWSVTWKHSLCDQNSIYIYYSVL